MILTIHQPRLEIFHLFRHLVLLSNGKVNYQMHYRVFKVSCLQQVSYSDCPEKAYEVFVNALASKYLDHGRVIPTLFETHNPAGE